MAEQTLRLFVSSPGDVPDERRRIDLVVERLNTEFAGRVRLETVRWETAYYSAHDTFQPQIPEAAACDVVIAVFRARLGTPLPASFPTLPSGEPYPSGTAYEVLSAIDVRKRGNPLPDIYVFRYPNAPAVALDAPDRAAVEAEWERLKGFFGTWFHSAGEFLAAFQTYESTDDFARRVEECLRQWLIRRGHTPQGAIWDRGLRGSPFPGLSAFAADRGSVFFGRDLAIKQAIERLREAGDEPDRLPFLLIVGASGAGKSSLLRAGLLPRLMLPGTIPDVDHWRAAIVVPAPDPFTALAEGLLADAAFGSELREGAFARKELLAKQLAGDPAVALAPLHDAASKAALRRQRAARFETPRPVRLALAIDQAERLFAETDPAAAAAFAVLLAELVRQRLAFVMLALRSDAYARFQGSPALVGLREAGATFDLVPPTATELEEVVVRPVAACRPPLAFEHRDGRSLASLLVADARGGDALPLLQMTLSRLDAAEAARGDGLLRFDDYRGMDAAVTQTANEALDMVSAEARGELPALMTGLVSDVAVDPLTGTQQPVVAALDRAAFEAGKPARAALVEAFVGKRLLTAEGDGAFERVRPVHEALLRIWPQAVDIVAETASLIRVRHTLEPIVREWEAASEQAKPRHLDVSPVLLDGAQQLLARMGDDLPPPMRAFITEAAAADAARRDRERLEQERRLRDAQALAAAHRRTARRTGVGLLVALLLAGMAGWQWWVAQTQTSVAQTQTQRAERSARDAEIQRAEAVQASGRAQAATGKAQAASGRALAALADLRINDGDVATGTLLALEAAGKEAGPEIEGALINGRLHLREFAVLPAQRIEVHTVAFSRDDRLVVTAASREAQIWDAATAKPLMLLSGHAGSVTDAAFSPDGSRVATASEDGTARIWSVRSGATEAVLRGHADQVLTVAFSPDGTLLATASRDKTARIWDVSSGRQITVLSGHTDWVSTAVFSPDGGSVLTTSQDRTAAVWDARTGTRVARFTGHGDWVKQGSFSPDGKRVVTASLDGTAAIWDSRTGAPIVTLKGHTDRVFEASFIPGSDRIVTASYDQTARIWDAASGSTLFILPHLGIVFSARPSANGRFIVTASTDATARVWDAATGRATAVLSGHAGWVMKAVISADGRRVVTAGRDRTARLWVDNATTISTGRWVRAWRLWRAALSPDGSRAAAASNDDTVRIWDTRTGAPMVQMRGHTAFINAVVFDATGRRVLSAAEDRTARVWDAATGRPLMVLRHDGSVSIGAFSPDGQRIVTAASDGEVIVWNAETGERLLKLVGHTGSLAKVSFSPDSKQVLTASPIDGTVRLWDAQTGKPIGADVLLRGDKWSAVFSPDGRRIVATSLDVTIVDAKTGDIVADYPVSGERVMDAVYSPGGRYLILGSLDGTTRIWNAENGRQVAVLGGFVGGVRSVATSVDGRRLLSAFGGGTLQVMQTDLTSESLVADLRPLVPRCLTPDERATYNLTKTPPEWCFTQQKWPYDSRAWRLWHAHRSDKPAPPAPGMNEWLFWVAKTGGALIDKKPAEAVDFLQEAVAILDELSDSNANSRWQLALAENLIDLGRAFKAAGRQHEAIAAIRRGSDIILRRATSQPANQDLKSELAYAYQQLGAALLAAGERAEALTFYRAAVPIRRALAAIRPERQAALAELLEKLAEEMPAEGAKSERVADAREAVALRRKLAVAKPGDAELQEDLAYAARVAGDALLADDQRAAAIAAFRESFTIRQALVEAQPQSADRESRLVFVAQRLAAALEKDGKTVEAVDIRGRILVVRRKLAAAEPDKAEPQRDLALAAEAMGMAQEAAGRHVEAIDRFREALAAREQLAVRIEREETASKGAPGAATAGELGSVAWYALLARNFERARVASQRAAALGPDLLWTKTNLAHALMFLDRPDEARRVYLLYRGKKAFEDKLWEQSVSGDFDIFRQVGLTNPLMAEIEKAFAAKM